MKEIFHDIICSFENEDIREFAQKCIDNAPPYWYIVPASSTGKYHPAYSLGDSGLVRHTIALVRILNHIMSIESIRDQFTSRERDLLRVAGIAHDMMKSGSQEEYERSKWTVFDHPIRAAKMVKEMDGLPSDEINLIAHAIESHMGQWNTDKRNPDVILPKPQDKYQIVLHLADYLASRKDIDIKFDGKQEIKNEKANINTWKFTFGKYNGKTIPDVYKIDPGYIIWAKNNMEREPARSLLQQFDVNGDD